MITQQPFVSREAPDDQDQSAGQKLNSDNPTEKPSVVLREAFFIWKQKHLAAGGRRSGAKMRVQRLKTRFDAGIPMHEEFPEPI